MSSTKSPSGNERKKRRNWEREKKGGKSEGERERERKIESHGKLSVQGVVRESGSVEMSEVVAARRETFQRVASSL